MPVRACGPFLLALALAACGDRTSPSAEENSQLENAADLLDSAPGELANVDENSFFTADDNSTVPPQ